MTFPGFYKGKGIISAELQRWIGSHPEPTENFTEFCRRMRIMTGQGRKTVIDILNEDYPSLEIENDRVIRRG